MPRGILIERFRKGMNMAVDQAWVMQRISVCQGLLVASGSHPLQVAWFSLTATTSKPEENSGYLPKVSNLENRDI